MIRVADRAIDDDVPGEEGGRSRKEREGNLIEKGQKKQ
jgi:hypothetical protein